MFLKSLFACSSLISCVNRGGQASFSAPAVCLYLTSFHAACQCQMYYSISFLSSLLPISLTACCCSSPAYNWIWVWNRRAVGSEIKEGRLSLHLRWGTQISPNFLSPRTTFSQSFHFWSTEHLLIQKVGNSDKNSVIILIEKSHTVCINWTVYSCALVCGFIPRANLEFEVYEAFELRMCVTQTVHRPPPQSCVDVVTVVQCWEYFLGPVSSQWDEGGQALMCCLVKMKLNCGLPEESFAANSCWTHSGFLLSSYETSRRRHSSE